MRSQSLLPGIAPYLEGCLWPDVERVYGEARYGLTIRYQEPPLEPRLEPAYARWVAACTAGFHSQTS